MRAEFAASAPRAGRMWSKSRIFDLSVLVRTSCWASAARLYASPVPRSAITRTALVGEKTMKFTKIAAASAAFAALYAYAAPEPPMPPIVEITSPTTATVFSSSWPVSVPITTRITMQEGEIGRVTQFNIKVNNAVVLDNTNPYKQGDNTCNLSALYSCTSVSPVAGTITAPFSVSAPGVYTIVASARYQNDIGSDAETLTYMELAVEYPAPPAVANAFLNSPLMKPLMTAGQRGCVISKIAENHAKLSAYGPKGGPYNQTSIQNDASNFLSQCPR
jgi:hypothetical protein